ncbi:centrobin [Xyrauchen texanus]|uniref:centrobin n=1 Tax=Xyrauchen texanus TaxID=154827 RepID=UPI0022422D63|nr:centrobin [Xyrauchen texanus]
MARFQARKLRGSEMSDNGVLSDVKPLPPSPPLHHSWPSSLSALTSSRQVTAHLYSSLQHSREQEVKGHTAARQVSFAHSSPDLTTVRMTAATPPLLPHSLEESQEVDCSLDSSSCGVIGSGVEEVESEVESETDRMSNEMDLHLQNKLIKSAHLTSGRRHIEEMENVRTHLQSILRKTAAADTHEFGVPVSHHFLDDSQESDATSHLLSAGVSVGTMEDLFPLYSRLHVDTGRSASELQVLRESLERERSRRKVCEQQVASLQNKVLHLQQQLTLAVAADRKKDIMIEQLDKTLVKVVEGWKRHDQDRIEEMKRLQEEKETAETTHSKHREDLSRVELNLSKLQESLDKEQKHKQELHNTNKQLEQQLLELRLCVEKLQQEEQRLLRDADRERDKLNKLHTDTNNTHTQLQQHIQELQQQLTHTSQQLERERAQVKQEVSLREETDSRSQLLQEELDHTRRERDTLRVDRALEQTQFEAQKSQMEVEFRLSLEQQLNEKLSTIQEENTTHTTQLRQQHRKQLLDLSARHERDLSAQLDQFRTQLQEKEHKLQQLTHFYQNKLSEVQEELVSMAASKRRLETHREELVSRLQGMMRSHWAEALRLLANQEQMESVFSPVPQWEASKTSSTPQNAANSDTHLSGAQAVVLHLSREKERGMREDERESVLNYSSSFTPLEPVLDQTSLTALSDSSGLWVRPVFAGGGNGTEGKMKDTRINQNQDLNRSQCEPNQIRVNQILNPKQRQPPTETRANHSSSSDSGRGMTGASVVLYSSDSEKTPPIRDEAPASRTSGSSLSEDRQSELQFYVSKLLERSPGDPLEEPIREQHQAPHVTDLLHTHTSQQLQEILQSFSRSDEGGVHTLRSQLQQKADEHDKRERDVPPRVVPSRRSVGRRGASQRVWR